MSRRPPSLIRLTIAGSLVLYIGLLILGHVLLQLRDDNQALSDQNRQLIHQLADNQAQIAELESEIQDLKSRWLGTPALWQPSQLPANTTISYFDVTGTTQPEILQSILAVNLCQHSHCLPEPGNPNAQALALEGETAPGTTYCYSPRTFTLVYTHVLTLPRWNAPRDGSTKIAVVEAWNALMGVIYTHESKHATIAETDIAAINDQAHAQPTCAAAFAVWNDPHVFDKLYADQAAYHAQLRADCRPEIGCLPAGWMGW